MPLSWNDIKGRAIAFAKEWGHASDERAQSQSFWIEFFAVFGLSSRRVSSFEHAVKKHGGGQGFADLFWPGMSLTWAGMCSIVMPQQRSGTAAATGARDSAGKAPRPAVAARG